MQKLISFLQLKFKWVRAMLIISAVAILSLLLIPKITPTKSVMKLDETTFQQADSITEIDVLHPIIQPTRRDFTPSPKIHELKTTEKEPFDWKGTITWAIGAMNGLILIVLNIKNLVFKKK